MAMSGAALRLAAAGRGLRGLRRTARPARAFSAAAAAAAEPTVLAEVRPNGVGLLTLHRPKVSAGRRAGVPPDPKGVGDSRDGDEGAPD